MRQLTSQAYNFLPEKLLTFSPPPFTSDSGNKIMAKNVARQLHSTAGIKCYRRKVLLSLNWLLIRSIYKTHLLTHFLQDFRPALHAMVGGDQLTKSWSTSEEH